MKSDLHVTWLLVAANLLVFLIPTSPLAMLWPVGDENYRWWQCVTYAFVHASVPHLLLNLLALVSFGVTLEREFGKTLFLSLYAISLVGAGLVQAAFAMQPTVGASGGIFGLFLAVAWQHPDRRVWMLIPPIGMKAKNIALLYAAITAVMIYTGWLPMVAHVAHLAGMAFALAFCMAISRPKD